ncbi:MAG: PRC-barrel domain-containing protein [Opitutales bacterium]
MKNRNKLLSASLIALTLALPGQLLGDMDKDDHSSENSYDKSKQENRQSDHAKDKDKKKDTREYTLIPGEALMGTDIQGSDGQKLGDIVDLVIDLDSQKVTHALVMTGGILDLAGDVRAVPAGAISQDGYSFSMDLTKDEFTEQDTMPAGRLEALTGEYGRSLEKEYGKKHSEAAKTARKSDAAVLYTDLVAYEIEFSEGTSEVERLVDVLVDMGNNAVAYLELRGVAPSAFDTPRPERRTMIPVAHIDEVAKDRNTLHLETSLTEARNADSVNDLEEIERGEGEGGMIYSISMK